MTEVGQLTVDGKKYTVSSEDLEDQLKEWANAYNSDAANTDWTAKVNDAGDGIVYTAKEAGSKADDAFATAVTGNGGTLTDGEDSPFGKNGELSAADIVSAIKNGQGKAEITLNGQVITDIENVTLKDGATYKISGNGYTLSFTQVADDNGTAVLDRVVALFDKNGTKLESGKTADGLKGDYNVSTSFNKPDTEASIDRIASTYYDLTGDMVKDGGSLFIGGKDYTFTTDKAAADEKDSGKVYIGDLLDAKGRFDASAANLEKVAERVTVAAKDNKVWSVSYDKSRLTFTEQLDDEGVAYTQQSGAEYDFTKMEDVEKSLGFRAPAEAGTALTLQIGDTSDSFNQLKVSVGDMHTKALGIDDINIGTPEGAQAAVNVIKDAINQVSSVRGTLGAISNRLDHTANNLSVMAENIQDAESAIRDTDIANEMMSYTKNNILVQSAQAMLAQANQVPQGVLQLLQ
ncbi:hypothetical protein D3Z48_18860 [Clostridiaceae bacterium]|nr:hypothetical protein [Clostridiaceae bacterium]